MPKTPENGSTRVSGESGRLRPQTAWPCGIARHASERLRVLGMAWEASALPTELRPRALILTGVLASTLCGQRHFYATSTVSRQGRVGSAVPRAERSTA